GPRHLSRRGDLLGHASRRGDRGDGGGLPRLRGRPLRRSSSRRVGASSRIRRDAFRIRARPARAEDRAMSTRQEDLERERHMLMTIAIILVILWVLGLVSSYTLGGFIHALLVIAIIVLLVNFISGRKAL